MASKRVIITALIVASFLAIGAGAQQLMADDAAAKKLSKENCDESCLEKQAAEKAKWNDCVAKNGEAECKAMWAEAGEGKAETDCEAYPEKCTKGKA